MPIRSRGTTEFVVSSNTPVVNHTDGWALHIDAKDWNPDLQVNFAPQHAGLILAEEGAHGDCGLRLVVNALTGSCDILSFADWTLRPPTTILTCAVASRWEISLPGNGIDLQWPLR